MPLIRTGKHTPEDIATWDRLERAASIHAQLSAHSRRVADAARELEKFAAAGPCYVGVSWGKDSVCVADIAERVAPTLPLVWVRVDGVENPDCPLVRDEFLRMWPSTCYHEIRAAFTPADERSSGQLTSSNGYAEAARRFGRRYVSGIRADESAQRRKRAQSHGLSTTRTCAPLSRWNALDVFAYLLARGLPAHPAYGYLMGGLLDPGRVRVSAIGGDRGTGHGRREWEEFYYPQEMRAAPR